MRRRGRGKSKRKRNGDQLVDYAVTGKTVELQTAETLFRGIVAHYDTEGEIYTLKSAEDVTNNLKIPGNCVISGVKMKRVLPEERQKRESNQTDIRARQRSLSAKSGKTNGVSEHEDSCSEKLVTTRVENPIEETSECPLLIIPDDVNSRSSALFRNLRGKKIKPDEQPPHLNKLRTRLPPTGICELIKEHNLNGNNSEHGTGVFSGVQVEEKSNTDPDSFGRNLRISADESKPCDNKIEHRSVIYVSNQFELVLACENLINEPVIGLSIQGDLRSAPACVSLICFSTPQTCILVDFISCGAGYGIMRDCFQEILESVSVLKVCMECGIVAEVLRANFQIKLTNVFDPQVVDGFLAAGFDAASLVPDQYYGLRTLLRYYLPTNFETFPTYCFKSQADYKGWLERPLGQNYLKVGVAEVQHLIELYHVQQNRINAKCAFLINSRLRQFSNHKGLFTVCMPCQVGPEMLQDQREVAKAFAIHGNIGRKNQLVGLNMPFFSKNINHHHHKIDLSLGSGNQ